ncbi:hypothetical protein [Caproiciproducens galactitolivorans]|uniref:Uncharacterized protein n=1 Tax=Caproiciproducens galactitolivorans TaxID=642589 RepID=A0ABT4BRT1_9FIRM|nr:hypothetical protein [Caproiciproducens galactitolivorans]MCY1713597.1 hypothetical protein [Caproiciproducens galactitolivorans]
MKKKVLNIFLIIIFFVISYGVVDYIFDGLTQVSFEAAWNGAIEWKAVLFHGLYLLGLVFLYQWTVNENFKRLSWGIGKGLGFITCGLVIRFILDKAFANILQIESIREGLFEDHYIMLMFEICFILIVFSSLFLIFGKRRIVFQKVTILSIPILICIGLILLSAAAYAMNASYYGNVYYAGKEYTELTAEEMEKVKIYVQSAMTNVSGATIGIISPCIYILFIKLTQPRREPESLQKQG